jgi:hypothetical protein
MSTEQTPNRFYVKAVGALSDTIDEQVKKLNDMMPTSEIAEAIKTLKKLKSAFSDGSCQAHHVCQQLDPTIGNVQTTQVDSKK